MPDLDCQSIMRRTTTSLYEDDPVSTAIDFMVERHMGLVPVVDRDEVYVGEISGDRLMHAMLPQMLRVVRGIKRASYLRESLEDMEERLHDLGRQPIGSLIDRHVPVVHPDTPLIDAILLLSQNHNVVPVVDPESGKLLGAISFFTVLKALEEARS